VETLFGLLRLFFLNCKLRIARSVEFRFDFVLGLFVSLMSSSIGPLVQFLIFTRTKGYPGWNLHQILLFQGVLLLWSGLKDTIFGEMRHQVLNLINKGEFDRLLLKPYPPIGILLTSGFYLYSFGTIIAGIALVAFSIHRMHLIIGFGQLGLFFLFLISGLILYTAISVLYCTVVIMLVFVARLGEILDKILRFSEYPIEIFPRVTRIIFITVLPFAIWVYFPAQALIDRVKITALISVACSFILFWLSLQLWNICLKKYTSAGG
jgi:ABC-2 type transport system permease protein